MDSYTILCTDLRGSAQSLNGNIAELQKKAEKLQKAIKKVTRGDYKASDLSAAYTAQTALTGSITRLGEICGAMNSAAMQFSEASTELSGRANLTAYYMQHTDTLSYEGLMGTYSAAIASSGSAAAGYELVKDALKDSGYAVGDLGSVSNAVQDAMQREAEEQARREEEAKWAKIGLTGLVIVGGIVASVFTGGAAAPIVIGAVSGMVMAGGNTAIDQYAEHGWDTDSWDYAEIGKDAFVGGVTGAATAWIGGAVTDKAITGLRSSASSFLNSSNAAVRLGTGAFVGGISESAAGVVTRGAGSLISSAFEPESNLQQALADAASTAFDGKQIAKDFVLGGTRSAHIEYKQYSADMRVRDFNEANNPTMHAEQRGYTLKKSINGTLEYSGTEHIMKSPDGSEIIVEIKATGSRKLDFDDAWAAAKKKYGISETDFDSVTWQHMDDYNVRTNTFTLELVDRNAHMGIKHSGGCKQYEVYTGEVYK